MAINDKHFRHWSGQCGLSVNMLEYLDITHNIVRNADGISSADKLIFPGVGAFDNAIGKIEMSVGLKDAIRKRVQVDKVPILGICLGMQLLFDRSDEGFRNGLGLIPGKVVLFDKSLNIKIPHMGWNSTSQLKESALLSNYSNFDKYYFVHSYHAVPNDKNVVLLTSQYARTFVAAVQSDNIYGVQFHPEKSHKYGMKILKSFFSL